MNKLTLTTRLFYGNVFMYQLLINFHYSKLIKRSKHKASKLGVCFWIVKSFTVFYCFLFVNKWIIVAISTGKKALCNFFSLLLLRLQAKCVCALQLRDLSKILHLVCVRAVCDCQINFFLFLKICKVAFYLSLSKPFLIKTCFMQNTIWPIVRSNCLACSYGMVANFWRVLMFCS